MALTKIRNRMMNARYIDVMDYGAVGDSDIESGGGTDDTTAINSAITAAKAEDLPLYAPYGYTFRITSAVDMRSVKTILFYGNIYADTITGSPAVTIGGFATGGARGPFIIGDVHDGVSRLGTSPTDPLLRVWGMKGSILHLKARYLQIYADYATANGTSNAYNQIHLDSAHKVELKGTTGGTSWNNENIFYGGRINTLLIGTDTSEYKHNHNMFLFPTMEGAITINIQSGKSNSIENARFESVGSGSFTFSSSAISNTITNDYSSGDYDFVQSDIVDYSSTVTDNGMGNIIVPARLAHYAKHVMVAFDQSTPLVSNGTIGSTGSSSSAAVRGLFDENGTVVSSPMVGLKPGLDITYSQYGYRTLYCSDFIGVDIGDQFAIEYDNAGTNAIRYGMYVYDDNFQLLGAEGAGGSYVASPGISYDGAGFYRIQSNTDSSDDGSDGVQALNVVRSDVKYVKLVIHTGNGATNIRKFAAYFYEKPKRSPRQVSGAIMQHRQMTLPSIPTAGYVEVGTTVVKDDGLALYTNTFQYEDTLNGALSTSATSVTINNIGSVANGDVVGILLDDGTTHWSAVSALSGSTFTVSALPSAAADGNRIAFNRWATLS